MPSGPKNVVHASSSARLGLEADPRFALCIDQLFTATVSGGTSEVLLRNLLEVLAEAGRAEVAVATLREHDLLCVRAALGLEEETARGFSLPIDSGLVGETAVGGAPFRLSAKQSEGLTTYLPFLRPHPLRAVHCLPLMAQGQLVGAVYTGSQEDGDLAHEDLRLLSVLSLRAASALHHHIARESLERAIRSRDDVLSVVAHDLRNPIAVISIAATSLIRRLPDSAARRTIDRIIRGAQRAERLVRDLLEINAIETGRFSVTKHTVEPAHLIFAALESQQSLAADASVIIATDLSPALPTIEADDERILEVLENLIGNAIKFTGSGGSITVGAKAQGAELLVWVKDTGAGIAPEELPHIFDRFWQARKTERRGTGLGLSICKGIVEAHGGRIWAESTSGEGTTVSFALPSTVALALKHGKPDVANILLVDDRAENLLALTAILERPEYRLVTATSGEEALKLALREQFSVALLDVSMPGMDGLEVAVHLKELERSRDIPIIFITAFGNDPEEIHRAYSAGGADYLVKPLDAEIVRKKVAVFVDLSRRRQSSAPPRGDDAART